MINSGKITNHGNSGTSGVGELDGEEFDEEEVGAGVAAGASVTIGVWVGVGVGVGEGTPKLKLSGK